MTMPKDWKPGSQSEKTKNDKDELVFELIKRRYDTETEKINALEAKGASLIGFVSVVVGLIAGGGSFQLSVIAKYWYLYVPYFVSIALLLASISLGLMAFKGRHWKIAPSIEVIRDKFTRPNTSYSYVLETTGAAMIEAIDSLEKTNKKKADYMDLSWWLLIAGLVLIFIFLMFFAHTLTTIQNSEIGESSKNITSNRLTNNKV